MKLTDKEIKEAIIQSGFATEQDILEGEKIAHDQDRPLIDVLIERGILLEKFLGQALADYLKIPFVDLKNRSIKEEILRLLPEDISSDKRVVAFEKKNQTLLLAMEDPHDLETIEFIKKKTGLLAEAYYTLPSLLDEALDQYHRDLQADFKKEIIEHVDLATRLSSPGATDLPVVKILETLLQYAASEKASDMHIENVGEHLVVRFRIDGRLKDVFDLPTKIQAGLITRIKIMANLRTDEHRLPQDGRFRYKHRNDEISVRVSILPTFHGEDSVCRLLSSAARPKTLQELGLNGNNLKLVENELTKPHGMILATGPTGSGKTTTLYNILTILNTSEVNICTIEDPIEYGLPRVNQIQVNPTAGLTFASGLRSILRHDPDIILVGEIRDEETAEIAIHSALTGHLVLSSLHTNDAIGAVPRLLDLGAQPYLIGSSLSLVIAQRLVARNCASCLVSLPVEKDLLNVLKKSFKIDTSVFDEKEPKQYKSRGCSVCNNEGTKGRVGIFEILVVSDELKKLIFAKAPIQELELQAKKEGFKSMIEDGLEKVQAGTTTLEEVLAATRE